MNTALKIVPSPTDPAAADALADCEQAIDAGYTLMRYGLTRISTERLYEAKGYATFDDYLTQVWGEKWGYKRRSQIKQAYGLVSALHDMGVTLAFDNEAQLREARRLVKALTGARTGEAAAVVCREVLGADVSNTTARALVTVLREAIDSGAVSLHSGEQVLLREAVAVETQEAVERSKAARIGRWVLLDDLIEQCDLALECNYNVQRLPSKKWWVITSKDGYWPPTDTLYDAMLNALAVLYDECEGL